MAIHGHSDVHEQVVSFESWCGGLPHPDNADNVLKYKFRFGVHMYNVQYFMLPLSIHVLLFSWSPRTVLLAALRTAKFIKDERVCVCVCVCVCVHYTKLLYSLVVYLHACVCVCSSSS